MSSRAVFVAGVFLGLCLRCVAIGPVTEVLVEVTPYGNTQVMNSSDMTLLFLNPLRHVAFLVVSVRAPGDQVSLQESLMEQLILPRKPVLVLGQQRRSDTGEEIMRGFYPEQEYIVVEPLDPLPQLPDQFPGTFDATPYYAAREAAMSDGLMRVARGGGTWFRIERIPRTDGGLVRKEDYRLQVSVPEGITSETARGRADIASVQLVRRAQDIPQAEQPRTVVTQIPSPVAAYLTKAAREQRAREAVASEEDEDE